MDKLEAMDAYYKTHFDTSDLERVVRCKDCKWYECGGLPCPLDALESLGDYGYCSRGERKE